MFATWVTVVLCSSPELYPLFEKKKIKKEKKSVSLIPCFSLPALRTVSLCKVSTLGPPG